jgi:hypothetical protein
MRDFPQPSASEKPAAARPPDPAQEIEETFFKPDGWNSRMSATAKKKSAYMALGFGLAGFPRPIGAGLSPDSSTINFFL